MTKIVGVLHPGAMGSSVAACARAAGNDVRWASAGRSEASQARAVQDGLRDAGELSSLVADAQVLISVCPPSEARALADAVFELGFTGTFVDANAIDPATATGIAAAAAAAGVDFIDGGIVGPPARAPGRTVLYLSGDGAQGVGRLFDGSDLETVALPGGAGRASAMKMAYAAYTKGHAALLLAVRALARAEQVEAPLLAHWERTHQGLAATSEFTAKLTAPKAWRFAGEMREIAATFEGAGLPGGFHDAAAELYGRLGPLKDSQEESLDSVLAALLR